MTDSRSTWSRLSAAGSDAVRSSYFWACIVYLIYNFLMIGIDFCDIMYPLDADGNTHPMCRYGDDEESGWLKGSGPLNKIYLATAIIHAINAAQYAWAWREYGVPLSSPLLWPDYTNLCLALLFVYTATQYPAMGGVLDESTMPVHNAELAAAVLEVFASFGWVWSWWMTYYRLPGRGLTLDDPDLWGVAFLVAPSIIYLVYNVQISLDPSTYGSNLLYVQGDILYAVGAVAYMLTALRDSGFFWWTPTAGSYDWVYLHKARGSLRVGKGAESAALLQDSLKGEGEVAAASGVHKAASGHTQPSAVASSFVELQEVVQHTEPLTWADVLPCCPCWRWACCGGGASDAAAAVVLASGSSAILSSSLAAGSTSAGEGAQKEEVFGAEAAEEGAGGGVSVTVLAGSNPMVVGRPLGRVPAHGHGGATATVSHSSEHGQAST